MAGGRKSTCAVAGDCRVDVRTSLWLDFAGLRVTKRGMQTAAEVRPIRLLLSRKSEKNLATSAER